MLEKLSVVEAELLGAQAKLSDAKYLTESFEKQKPITKQRMIASSTKLHRPWALFEQNTPRLISTLFNSVSTFGEMTKVEILQAWVLLQANLRQLPMRRLKVAK